MLVRLGCRRRGGHCLAAFALSFTLVILLIPLLLFFLLLLLLFFLFLLLLLFPLLLFFLVPATVLLLLLQPVSLLGLQLGQLLPDLLCQQVAQGRLTAAGTVLRGQWHSAPRGLPPDRRHEELRLLARQLISCAVVWKLLRHIARRLDDTRVSHVLYVEGDDAGTAGRLLLDVLTMVKGLLVEIKAVL